MDKTIYYFIFFCLSSRLLLALLAKIIESKYLPIMGLFTIFISISFFYKFYKK